MRYTFSRDERLRSAKIINQVYRKGVSGYIYPFRYSYIKTGQSGLNPTAQVLIAVSKRRIRKAVDRNLVRRRIREAYRLNKSILHSPLSQSRSDLAIAFTYIAGGIESYQEIERKLVLLLRDIAERVSAESSQSKEL